MSLLHNMRIIEIPKFRAVSSGPKTLDELFDDSDSFSLWIDNHQSLILTHIFEPQDFLWHEENDINQSVWIHAVKPEVTEEDTAPYPIIEFPGGIYLVATGNEKNENDLNETVSGMLEWIKNSEIFEYGRFPKSGMCNMPNPDGIVDTALGIAQQQIFLPLQFRAK